MVGDSCRYIRINVLVNPEVISSPSSELHRQSNCEYAFSKIISRKDAETELFRAELVSCRESTPRAEHNRFVPTDKEKS
jgi:hypothetical protein